MLLQCSVGLCASLQATFYPIEADRKGATPAQFGPVFGIIHLSLFIFGPLVGKYLPIWGVKTIFPAGFIINGGTFIMFGMLQWVTDCPTFLFFSYLIRFLEGVGAAATWTSNLSVLMAKFPERKATVKAWCDAAFCFGLTIGPVIGAFMYTQGGFFLPFAALGTVIIISGFLILFVTDFPSMDHGESRIQVLPILKSLHVLISLFSCIITAYTIGTIEATLTTFLQDLDISIHMIAIAFLVMSLSSVLATPIFGFLCDSVLSPWLVTMTGSVLMFISFLFIGPSPYLALFNPSFASVTGCLAAQGFGSAAVLVASFGSAQLSAVSTGCPESLGVQAAVSGLFTSAFALGNFSGPTLSSLLFDKLGGGRTGFAFNSLIVQGLVVVVLLANAACYFASRTSQSQAEPPAPDSKRRVLLELVY